MRRNLLPCLLVVALSILAAGAATLRASEIVTRDATRVSLRVDAKGRALVTFTQAGTVRHVLYWGAVDALAPVPGGRQVAFRRDFTGGERSMRSRYWLTMKNACSRYRGPRLPWLVSACTAPDGSHWALQSWQRMLPNLGLEPWRSSQGAWELHVSHWTGDPARLVGAVGWSASGGPPYVFGRLTYRGAPVYGFASTPTGAPLDRFGRNVFLDTLDSAYGPGWLRENSFLTHGPDGSFCYGFYPHAPYPGYPAGDRPSGAGERYRLTVVGPGVTPDVVWEDSGPLGAAQPDLLLREAAAAHPLAAAARLCAAGR